MTTARFLQIHTLQSYTAALLNRDDSGLAKRLPYGGAMRTRISSQCLKRHWRKAEDDPHALLKIAGVEDAFRSRELVTIKVMGPLRGRVSEACWDVLENVFQTSVYGDKGDKKKGRQTLLFGAPQLKWLAGQAETLAPDVDSAIAATVTGLGAPPKDEKGLAKYRDDRMKKCLKAAEAVTKPWKDKFSKNMEALREAAAINVGLTSALFGRMVTSDPAANIEAPIHVAHAFTVHQEETEGDYFTAVDDLKREEDDSGADTIQETELTSGLYYGYVVIDIPGLVSNLTGCKRAEWLAPSTDRTMAAEVVHNLLYLIAEISPGAKLGSTAPYGRAELVLVEAGDRQPRSLSAAYREAIEPNLSKAMQAMATHLGHMDADYDTGEARRALHRWNDELPRSPRASLCDIAQWAKAAVLAGEAQP
jgi:CRISPR system Cascade subunit CasC